MYIPLPYTRPHTCSCSISSPISSPIQFSFCSTSSGCHQMLQFPPSPMDSSRWKPNIELAPSCPRCASSNTKFCYFNNYNLSQPRYFCKACRRYWTKGGSLRNVPVGGGCRKTRRPKYSTHPQTARASVNYTATSSGISGSGVTDKPNEVKCSDIDMAVLFARFVNQNSEYDANGSSSSNLPTSLRPEGRLPQEESIEGEELVGIELEGLLGGDEAIQDVFWSDDRTSSSFTWQLQQELEYSMAMPFNQDGQLPIISSTNNLINDGWNWSSFDVSTLEAFWPKP